MISMPIGVGEAQAEKIGGSLVVPITEGGEMEMPYMVGVQAHTGFKCTSIRNR
jgi:hypothetical protein